MIWDDIMRTSIKILCSLFFFMAVTAGCGQKGPLFLPGDPATVQSEVEVAGQGQSLATAGEADEDYKEEEDEDNEDNQQ